MIVLTPFESVRFFCEISLLLLLSYVCLTLVLSFLTYLVAGKDIEDGTCIESPLDGVVASLSWNDQSEQASSMKRLLVWDTEAPCGDDDMVYVHFAGDEDGRTITNKQAPMTAGAGPKIHTYMAGWFDQLPVPAGSTGCQMMNVEKTEDGHMKGCDHTKKWKVARHSTPCPEESGEFH